MYCGLSSYCKIVRPDNNQTTYSYTPDATTKAVAVTVTDPTNKQKKYLSNALGQTWRAYEPDVTSGNALTVATDYQYTALGSLKTVTQGQQTRTFDYDPVNRLTRVFTPEAGTVLYSYKDQNNAACSIDTSSVCVRTDARQVKTKYGYDSVGRLKSVDYDVSTTAVPSTPSVTYDYGTSAVDHNNGRLVKMTDGTGSESYQYGMLGRLTSVAKLVSGTTPQTYTTGYAYNDAGQVTKITYPSGMVVKQGYDNLARLNSITEGDSTTLKTFASGLTYNDASQVTGFTMGVASSPIAASFGYTPERLQLSSLSYTQNSNPVFSLTYGYVQNGHNNGQITSVTDNTPLENGRSATYTYDALSRLTGFSTSGSFSEGGIPYAQKTMSWSYDRYGNRLTQVEDGAVKNLNPDPYTNRLTGYEYDASGNMTKDGTYAFKWDAEGRMVDYAAGSITYAYDGNGIRIKKTSGSGTTVYIRSGASTVAEYAANAAPTSPTREYFYFGSQLIASKAAGAYKWYVRDHLSPRGVYDETTARLLGYGHLPFGESWYGESSEKMRFTSYEREAGANEVNQDFAVFRQYSYGMGRFTSADPVWGSVGTPQSWNRFAYVNNSPVSSIDPMGLNAAMWQNMPSFTTWDGDLPSLYRSYWNFETSAAGAIVEGLSRYLAENSPMSYVICADGSIVTVPVLITKAQAAASGVCSTAATNSALNIPFVMYFADPNRKPEAKSAPQPQQTSGWEKYKVQVGCQLEAYSAEGEAIVGSAVSTLFFAVAGQPKVSAAFGLAYIGVLIRIREGCVEMAWGPGHF